MLYIQNQRNRSRSNWAKEHAWTMKLYSCFYIENFRNNRSATEVQHLLKFLTFILKKGSKFWIFFSIAQSPLHIVSAKELRIVNSKLQLIGLGISGLGLGPAYSPLLHLMCTLKH